MESKQKRTKGEVYNEHLISISKYIIRSNINK